MGWEIKPALLYQAYAPPSEHHGMGAGNADSAAPALDFLEFPCAEVPTVVRDILYGWARGFVAVALAGVWKPQTFTQEAGLLHGTILR